MDLFLQRIFDGLFNSAIYASLAIALVLIYRATGLLNFAQGEMATLSAYVAYILLTPAGTGVAGSALVVSLLPGIPWPIPLAIAGAVAFGMTIGALTERLLIRPLEGKSALATVNVTIGLLIAINAFMIETWSTATRIFPSPFPSGADDFVYVGGARVRYESIGVWLTLITVVLLLTLFLQKTKSGLAFRAITSNRSSSELVGIRTGRVLMLGWAIAAGLGALGAALVADAVLLEPFMMIKLLIFGFAAATIGGLDSPKGAIVGGIVIGIAQSLIPGYIPFVPSELSLLPAVVAMLIVLLVRPEGLFGTKRVERV